MSNPPYAKGTNVKISDTQAEIQALLERHGATAFVSGYQSDPPVMAITFEIDGMRFRYALPLPTANDDAIRYVSVNQSSRRRERSALQIEGRIIQARRERWRALLLVIKGQLVAVDLGIKTLAEALIAEAVIISAPGQPTVREWLKPQLLLMADQHTPPPLLPGISEASQ